MEVAGAVVVFSGVVVVDVVFVVFVFVVVSVFVVTGFTVVVAVVFVVVVAVVFVVVVVSARKMKIGSSKFFSKFFSSILYVAREFPPIPPIMIRCFEYKRFCR